MNVSFFIPTQSFLSLQCAVMASIATLVGALIARLLTQRELSIEWPWALSGGSLLALAGLDLIPEALSLTAQTFRPTSVMTLMVIAGISYTALEHVKHGHTNHDSRAQSRLGSVHTRAVIFIAHSVIDGIAIGLGFSDSNHLGVLMAIAIIIHDLSDGFNTMIFLKGTASNKPLTLGWLWLNTIAPVLGALLAILLHPSRSLIGALLAVLAGFFLSISLSVVLPHIFRKPGVLRQLVFYALGATFMGSLLLLLN
jgi:ZIP family zinc transporter